MENLPYLHLRSCCWDLIFCLQVSFYSIFILRSVQHLLALVNDDISDQEFDYDGDVLSMSTILMIITCFAFSPPCTSSHRGDSGTRPGTKRSRKSRMLEIYDAAANYDKNSVSIKNTLQKYHQVRRSLNVLKASICYIM